RDMTDSMSPRVPEIIYPALHEFSLNNQTHAGAGKGPGNTQMYQLVLKIPEEVPHQAIVAGRAEPRKAVAGMQSFPGVDL
ncbi:MAG: hypothetical protein PVJ14_11555, partial [Chromatiales bacterium]